MTLVQPSSSYTNGYTNGFTSYTSQTDSRGVVTGMPTSTNGYTNGFTSYTSQTDSRGVVTGMPTSVNTLAPAIITLLGTITSSTSPANGTVSGSSPCYYPNGQKNSIDVPCDPTALVSMCCGDQAMCLSNGLCQTINDQQTNANISYARGTCTDNQWGSSICPQHCLSNQDSAINSSAYNFREGGVQVWECSGSQGHTSSADYCCESEREGTRCCSTPTAIFRLGPATVGNFASSTTSHPAPTLTSPASSSTASSATATGTSSPQQKIPAGGIAGGVIGGVALLALAVLIWRFWFRRRKTKDRSRASWMKPELSADPKSNHSHSGSPYELQGNPERPPELPDHSRYELHGDLGGSEMMTLKVDSKGR